MYVYIYIYLYTFIYIYIFHREKCVWVWDSRGLGGVGLRGIRVENLRGSLSHCLGGVGVRGLGGFASLGSLGVRVFAVTPCRF